MCIKNAFSKSVVGFSVTIIYTGILRYLGGRFPETTSAVDENGRTALHYAASIKDNGHFYNLLVHLGSNPKTIDKVTARNHTNSQRFIYSLCKHTNRFVNALLTDFVRSLATTPSFIWTTIDRAKFYHMQICWETLASLDLLRMAC